MGEGDEARDGALRWVRRGAGGGRYSDRTTRETSTNAPA